MGKFADVNRRNKAGEFYTPRSVIRMMVEILDPKEGETIYDPTCGTGGVHPPLLFPGSSLGFLRTMMRS